MFQVYLKHLIFYGGETSQACERDESMEHLIRRPLYQRVIDSYRETEQVKVLQGVRRCGKSALLELTRRELIMSGVDERNIYSRRFDSFDAPLDFAAQDLIDDLTRAFEQADPSQTMFVFLDEIQEVAGWERVVRRLHTRAKTDVYLTGSNAHMLSSDLTTQLSGRYVAINVYPLSFSEFLMFKDACGDPVENGQDAALAEYMRIGGMPSLFALRDHSDEQIARELSAVRDTVILNDVARRMGVRDIALLQRLVAYLFSTAGNLFSANRIAGALSASRRKVSVETIDNYIDGLEKAYIVHGVTQEGLQGKELLMPLRKFYPVDPGLRTYVVGTAGENTGFQLESVVHGELLRRGYALTVGTLRSGEVDFVARRGQERLYVQVSESILDAHTREREFGPLRALANSFPKLVLTLDHVGAGITDDGIRIANVTDWLLEDARV